MRLYDIRGSQDILNVGCGLCVLSKLISIEVFTNGE